MYWTFSPLVCLWSHSLGRHVQTLLPYTVQLSTSGAQRRGCFSYIADSTTRKTPFPLSPLSFSLPPSLSSSSSIHPSPLSSFLRVDVTEAQFIHMTIMIGSFLFGPEVWRTSVSQHTLCILKPAQMTLLCISLFTFLSQIPLLGISFKLLLIAGVFGFSFINFFSTSIVILTMGKGKHGSTVAVSE